MPENPLEQYFRQNRGRLLHKWLHYFDIYDRHLQKFRDTQMTLVEFGVSHGGSLQMWKHYFGAQARIVGIDIDPRCASLHEPQIEVLIGDQGDPEFLERLRDLVGVVDVIIDDGGHQVHQQNTAFQHLFDSVRAGGVYLVEDLHTNYWREYGGGYRRSGTFIEETKGFIDQLSAWHSRDPESFVVDSLTRTLRSLHVYDSVVVFEKDDVRPPQHAMTGAPSFDFVDIAGPARETFAGRIDG